MINLAKTPKAIFAGYDKMTQMRTTLLKLLVFVTLIVPAVSKAQQDTVDPMTTEPNEMMKKLAWLAGTWEGEGEVPGAEKYASVMTYSVDLNGHVIRNEYQAVENGKVVWRDEGLIAYHADLKKVVSTSIGIDGSYSDGEGVFDSAGWTYTLTGHTAGATPFKEWRTIITKVNDDAAKTRFEILKNGNYEFFSEETMRRRK